MDEDDQRIVAQIFAIGSTGIGRDRHNRERTRRIDTPTGRRWMTMVTRSHVGLAALLSILLVNAPAFAADESNGVQQIEGGAKQIGGGVEEAAKGLGTTVVHGAKTA